MSKSILVGITRRGGRPQQASSPAFLNPKPSQHSPLRMHNRVQVDVVGPDGVVKQHVDHIENIMCTFGLNRLCELMATGGEASTWVSAYRIGTATDAAASTQDSLIASTASVALSAASMDASDQGDRTLRYVMTFASNNPAGTATINEVGIFCNSTANSQLAARAILSPNVSKGASDEIRISHDIVVSTG